MLTYFYFLPNHPLNNVVLPKNQKQNLAIYTTLFHPNKNIPKSPPHEPIQADMALDSSLKFKRKTKDEVL